jgi:transcriptional regulator with XRE-family HTH domain
MTGEPPRPAPAGNLIREARKRARLTQTELAARVGSSQSLVARWESGEVAPLFATVLKAVRACGLDLTIGLAEYDTQRDELIDERLALTPIERSRSMVRHIRSVNRITKRARRE